MYNKSVELALEEHLEKAFHEVTYRPQFLQHLLDSYIYILGSCVGTIGTNIEHMLTAESDVQIKQWQKKDGVFYFPFFTSLERLQNTIREEENYFRINTRRFFELTFGTQVVLNPYSDIGKEFSPAEIAGLLNGDFGLRANMPINLKKDTVSLSHPNPYPIKMVEQIKHLLQNYHPVASAYLAQVNDYKKIAKPTLVIGLLLSQALTEKEEQLLIQQVRHTAQYALFEKKNVDLLLIKTSPNDHLSQYFLHETQPFYVRLDEKKEVFFAKIFS